MFLVLSFFCLTGCGRYNDQIVDYFKGVVKEVEKQGKTKLINTAMLFNLLYQKERHNERVCSTPHLW